MVDYFKLLYAANNLGWVGDNLPLLEFNVCSSKNDLYFTYQIFNAFSKLSFNIRKFLVIWSKSIEASNLGLFVKYLLQLLFDGNGTVELEYL